MKSGSYIPTLDGWRAIAILLVLFDHSTLRDVYRGFPAYGWTHVGAHGVQIFFVLSGYLITGKLLEDNSLEKFYIRRAFRILPVVFTFLALISILGFGLHRIPLSSGEVKASLLFFRNYRSGSLSGVFTVHLWSLSVEEQFYSLWPLLMLLVVKGEPRQRLQRALWLFGISFPSFLILQLTVILHLGNVLQFYTGLAAGCLLALAFADAQAGAALRRVLRGRSAIAIAIVAAYFAVYHHRLTAFEPLFCALGLAATLVEPEGRVGRFLELPALRWIGRLSYSLYIWQQLFVSFSPPYRAFGFLSAFPVNFVSLVAFSCASYYLMEKPLVRLGHRLTQERVRAAPPAAGCYDDDLEVLCANVAVRVG